MTDKPRLKPHMTETTASERCLYSAIQACMEASKPPHYGVPFSISAKETLKVFNDAIEKHSQLLRNQYTIVKG